MKKDKQRDLIRAILPSTARRMARETSRAIHRRTRKHVKQALHLIDDEDYDESEFYRRIRKAESRHKSEMCHRIRDRRAADKLGPILRFTKHVKKRSQDDTEAREKIVKIIQPGKNLITYHAMTHVDNLLNCPGSNYYLPPEIERDEIAREQRNASRSSQVVWDKRQFRQIIRWLFECQHKRLNRALKGASPYALMTTRTCTLNDSCMTEIEKIEAVYEIFDPKIWSKWRKVYWGWDYNRLVAAGEVGRVRHLKKMERHHTPSSCQNALLARKAEDIEIIARKLSDWNQKIYENDFSGTSPTALILKEIRILVNKFEVL